MEVRLEGGNYECNLDLAIVEAYGPDGGKDVLNIFLIRRGYGDSVMFRVTGVATVDDDTAPNKEAS